MSWTNQGGFPSGGGSSTGGATADVIGAPRILRKDVAWAGGHFAYIGMLRWTTAYSQDGNGNWGDNNAQTGSLDYGYFLAGTKIHLAICGGGVSRGGQKIISVRDESNAVLLSKTLNEIAPRDAVEPTPATILTPGLAGQKVYIRFDDQDSANEGFSWLGVNLSSIVIED